MSSYLTILNIVALEKQYCEGGEFKVDEHEKKTAPMVGVPSRAMLTSSGSQSRYVVLMRVSCISSYTVYRQPNVQIHVHVHYD